LVSVQLSALEALAQRVGLSPASPLLLVALTHSSYAAEHNVESNERLEFLGDAVVDLAIADAIIRRYPDLNEGTGSLVRSRVVNEGSLALASQRLELSKVLLLGRGEQRSKGEERPSLLADAFEALTAAIYLENGFEAAKYFVESELGHDLDVAAASPEEADPKTRLRQWAEALGLETPVYEVSSEGPAHATMFEASVRVGDVTATGRGRSKKAAEAAAALSAWARRDA
jgi:ribonuclease-3